MAAQSATATFNGSQDFVDVTWPAMTGNYGIVPGAPVISDALGAVEIWATNPTSTGCRVNTTARFTGTVDVLVFDKP